MLSLPYGRNPPSHHLSGHSGRLEAAASFHPLSFRPHFCSAFEIDEAESASPGHRRRQQPGAASPAASRTASNLRKGEGQQHWVPHVNFITALRQLHLKKPRCSAPAFNKKPPIQHTNFGLIKYSLVP